MATPRKTNPSSILTETFILHESLSRLPVKTILESRSVCKSWLSLTSNPRFIKTQLLQSTNDNIFSWLPKLVVHNIFLRLAVEDLLRIKSVCKAWLSLVSSRGFIKTHLINSTNDPHFTNYQLIFCNAPFVSHDYRAYVDFYVRRAQLVVRSCPVYSLINGMVRKFNILENPANGMDGWTYVVGSCNGLVCLACFDGSVFLWNPSTRKSSRLPNYEHAHTVFGFGYDESRDDFKVFSVIGDGDGEYKVSVYSSNSDCWRMIGDVPFGKLSSTSRGHFAHGALHWLVSQTDAEKDIIVSLDMYTETHREVMQPDFGQGVYDLTLGTFGTSLSVLCQYKSGADLWVLKEYGVDEPWTKLFTFPIPCLLPYKPRIRPICMLLNGDVMMLIDLTMILNNPNKNEIQILFETEANPAYNIFQEFNVYTYVESLVSPPNLNR